MTGSTPPAQDWTPEDWTPDEAAVRAQLARILASDRFDASERNRRFLRYVVEECLGGRAPQIKAYSIAVSVFNREPSFDPQSDPIVRLEAGRLRRSLDHYYLTAGRNDPIRIVVPKGGYVPRFEPTGLMPEQEPPAPQAAPAPPDALPSRCRTARPAAALPAILATLGGIVGGIGLLYGAFAMFGAIPGAASGKGPETMTENTVALATDKPPAVDGGLAAASAHGAGITISPFRTIGTAGEAAALASVLTDEIVRALTAQTELAVRLEPGWSDGTAPPGGPAARGGQDVRLAGSLQEQDGHARVILHLTDEATGAVLWSERFEQPMLRGAAALVQGFAAQVTAPLTDPQGPLIPAVAARLRARPFATLSPRECSFLAAERRIQGPEERRALAACLERGTADHTLSASEAARLWSALSTLHADEHRAGADGTVHLENTAHPMGNATADKTLDRAFDGALDGALDRALAAATRATQLAPNTLRPLTALYTAYCLRRQYDLCFAAGEKALTLAPEDPKVLGDLGLWHVEAGDPAQGLALLDHAMKRDPAQAGRLLPAYGLARQRLGNSDAPPHATLHGDVTSAAPAQAALAVAFVQSGRIDEAREAATRALAADPAFAERSAREQHSRPLPPHLDATIRSSFAVVGLARQENAR